MIKGQLVLGRDGAISMQFDSNITLLPGQTYNVTLERAPDLHELRAVRLREWQHVCKLADRMCRMGSGDPRYAALRVKHSEHMRAVQALNDFFPLGDTAERDAATATAVVKL